MRLRHGISSAELALLPSGTASNESLHAEINSWTQSINAMHRSTFQIKLQVIMYREQLVHHMAMSHPFLRKVQESVLWARAVTQPLWIEDAWKRWCGQQHSAAGSKKSVLPLAEQRKKKKLW